jgi:hypothetical protein
MCEIDNKGKSIVVFISYWISIDLSHNITFLIFDIFANKVPTFIVFLMLNTRKTDWSNSILKHKMFFSEVNNVKLHLFDLFILK